MSTTSSRKLTSLTMHKSFDLSFDIEPFGVISDYAGILLVSSGTSAYSTMRAPDIHFFKSTLRLMIRFKLASQERGCSPLIELSQGNAYHVALSFRSSSYSSTMEVSVSQGANVLETKKCDFDSPAGWEDGGLGTVWAPKKNIQGAKAFLWNFKYGGDSLHILVWVFSGPLNILNVVNRPIQYHVHIPTCAFFYFYLIQVPKRTRQCQSHPQHTPQITRQQPIHPRTQLCFRLPIQLSIRRHFHPHTQPCSRRSFQLLIQRHSLQVFWIQLIYFSLFLWSMLHILVRNLPMFSVNPITGNPVTEAPSTPQPSSFPTPLPSKSPAIMTTASPATMSPVSDSPVSQAPSLSPATKAPISIAPATMMPATESPATASPVSKAPVTMMPITESPVTASPGSKAPVTMLPTSVSPISMSPITNTPSASPTATPSTSAPVAPTHATFSYYWSWDSFDGK